MKLNLFIFLGLILMAVGVIVFISVGSSIETATVNSPFDRQTTGNIVQYGVGGFLGLLGLFFLIIGMRMGAKVAKQEKLNQHILQTGIQSEGTVTFVDKNYSVLINKNPIYSIVEYTYSDNSGNKHMNRINYVSSEQVIRRQIVVGSKIAIKYSGEDAAKSIIIL